MIRYSRRFLSATLSIAIAILAIGMSTQSVAAQLGIEGIFKDIDDVNFYFGCWDTSSKEVDATGKCPSGNRDYGVEATFAVKEFTLRPSQRRDTLIVKQVVISRGRDTTVTYVPETKIDTRAPYLSLELGLGYSQFTGFRSSNPEIDLRGAVREIPAVSLYLSYQHLDKSKLIPYVGLRSGLIQLRDAQVFSTPAASRDTATVYNGEAQSFQLGVVGGLSLRIRRVAFFGEWALIDREFESVRWTSGAGAKAPAFLPRRLDFSGRSFSAGVQINIRKR